ncbi:MAG: hypothetical protein ACYS0E_22460 [Planctomycetota bacterium]|jgi:serine protease
MTHGAVAFDVSGTVSVSPFTAVDSDVNDPNASFAENDTPLSSQAIPAPGVVGGYLNNPGAGPVGRSQLGGDVVDYFATSMAAGTTATLLIAEDDANVHDLDLLLINSDDLLTDASMGTGKREQVTAPETGNYLVVVTIAPEATEAATNYLLVLGRDAGVTPAFNLRLQDEFVDRQAIVRFNDAKLSRGSTASLAARAASLGLEPRGGAPGRAMLFEMGAGAVSVSAMNSVRSARARTALATWLPSDPKLRKKLETIWLIKRLRQRVGTSGRRT